MAFILIAGKGMGLVFFICPFLMQPAGKIVADNNNRNVSIRFNK
jgi:hypothetical protein